ncbi:helix-turn-helix transcriptional regulator [Streptomyces sp. NPDC006482]|uniref:helix-turn-helix domain-containing protein n=1 Tax=Streptomyces sp. NPDC006482 TaxID=3154306 RepID=UPI0033AC2D2D
MAANGDPGYVGGEATPWAELAAEMRRIKVDTDLSYGKLAQRTHYSRSSWERFLNQKQLPTRVAVEQFAAASGQDPRPLLLRLEHSLAHESAGAGRDGVPAPGPRHPGAARNRRGPGRADLVPSSLVRPLVRPLGLVVAGALLGGLGATLARAVRLHQGGARQPRTV